jgi:hypothetical protein
MAQGLPCKRTDELSDFRLRATDEFVLAAIVSFNLDVEITSFGNPAKKKEKVRQLSYTLKTNKLIHGSG